MPTYFTPIPSVPNQIADADTFNDPMSQIDTAIEDHWTFTAAHQAELAGARGGYASLDARLDALIPIGGNIATQANGAASAGQKDVTVDSTVGFVATAYVAYTLAGGTIEYNTIASITPTTLLTLGTNIGTGGIADNTYISMISPAEYQAANAIHHGSTDLTLPQAMEYAAGGIYNVRAYGALGDGVANDAVAINLAVDAVRAAGAGIVYLPAGTYKVTAPIEIYDQSNLIFCGDGIEATIITSAATVDIDDPTHVTNATFGTIAVNTTLAESAALNNITLRDFTLKTSNSMSKPAAQKALYIGPVVNCSVDRVKIDGSANEALYHDGYPTAALTSGLHIRDCEFTNYYMLGVNTNGFTDNVEVTRCWFHDTLTGTHDVYGIVSGAGINILGTNIVITNNRFTDVLSYGVICSTEGTGDTWAQNAIIANNILDGLGDADGAGSVFALYVGTTGAYADCGLLIANNVIGAMIAPTGLAAYGIYAMGPWTITGNVLSGVSNADATGDIAISIAKDAYSGTAFVVCTNNTIEAKTSSHKWSSGIVIENDVHVSAFVAGNVVRSGAVQSYAYVDARGASIMANNMFNGPISIAGTGYNNSNEYDYLGVTLGKNQRSLGPYFRQTIDGWYQDNVANDQSAVALNRSAGASTDGFVAVRGGYLTGVAAHLSEASGGGTLSVEVYKNGSATGLIASVAPAYSFGVANQAPGTDSFAAGDVLDVRITTSGWSTTSADIIAAIEIET